ncbi:MAG TPA: hypothetical protein IAC17_02275 [Candidatus Faecousia faecipullorum]|nr:hypothetical protein [Candidatus Faecousia faecipullorum]
MVKGISRQVIVVHAPDQKLFEQAIFILKDDAVGEGVTDEALLKEAKQAIRGPEKRRPLYLYGAVWAAGGALLTGIAWLLTVLI